MSIKHDQMARKDIPSIYARSAMISQICRWPQGGLSVKPIQGKHIVNNTGKVIYVTGPDGICYAVPPLSDASREILLRQLYYMMNMELQYEGPLSTGNRRLFLDPKPVVNTVNRHGRNFFTEPARWEIEAEDVPMFTERMTAFSTDDDKYESFERYVPETVNEYIRRANDVDAYNTLTAALRRNEPSLFVVSFMFEESLRHGHDDTKYVPKVFNHVYRENRTPELLKINFDVRSPDGSNSSPEDVISSRHPMLLYSKVDLKKVERSHQGHFLPEYALTLSSQTDLTNKAIGFAIPESEVFMARTGLRIIVPQRPAGVSALYCRIGKHVSRINCTDNPDATGNHAIAYCFDANGDEVLAGSCHVDELLSKGMSLSTPDGVSWHIPFFQKKDAALAYYDPEDQAVFTRQKETIEKQEKQIRALMAETDKHKEKKRKGIVAWVSGFLANTKVMAVITGVVVSAVTAIVASLSGGNG